MAKLTFVNCDDYWGAYVDDELVAWNEVYYLTPDTVAEMCIENSVDVVETKEVNWDWFDDKFELPQNLSEVVFVEDEYES